MLLVAVQFASVPGSKATQIKWQPQVPNDGQPVYVYSVQLQGVSKK